MADPLDLLGAGLDVTQPVAGADLLGKTPELVGPGAKGWRGAVAGLKSSAAGGVRAVGDVTGIQPLSDFGARVAEEQNAIAAENQMRVEDVQDFGGAVDFAKYGLASAAPSLLTFLAGTLLGRGVGGALAKRAVETSTKDMLKTAGMVAGGSATSFGLEGGGSYNENLEAGVENPGGRAAAVGAANAALDTLFPVLVARRLRLLGAGEQGARKAGFGAIAKGAGGAVLTDVPVEAGTEGLQEYITALGAGKDLSDPATRSAILNAAVIGGLAGGTVGGVTGAVSKAMTPVEQPVVEPTAPVAAPTTTPSIVGDNVDNAHNISTPVPTDAERYQNLVADFERTQAQTPDEGLPSGVDPVQQALEQRARLQEQRVSAAAEVATLTEQLQQTKGRRDKILLGRQLAEKNSVLATLDTQIGDISTQIGVQPEIGPTLRPVNAPDLETVSSPLPGILAPSALDAKAKDTALLGSLFDAHTRGVQVPRQDVASSLQPAASDVTSQQSSVPEGRAEFERVGGNAADEAVMAIVNASNPTRTPKQRDKMIANLGEKVKKAVQQAAALPTGEDRAAAVTANVETALKQHMDPTARSEIAAAVSKAVGSIQYSKSAVRGVGKDVSSGVGPVARMPLASRAAPPVLSDGVGKVTIGANNNPNSIGVIGAEFQSGGNAVGQPRGAGVVTEFAHGLSDPEFQQWFRDSKAVTPDGQPLRVYHITTHDFQRLKPGGIDPSISGPAIWFTPNAEYQQAAHNVLEGQRIGRFKPGARVIPAYVRIVRPLVVDASTRAFAEQLYGKEFPYLMSAEVVAKLKADGYDGVMEYSRDPLDPKLREVIVFDQDQVRSAIDLQHSVAATNAAQDVYDKVMEQRGQDAIKQFQFLYGAHGEQFDIYRATSEQPNAGYYQAMQEMKDIIGFAFNASNLPSVADHEAFHALEQRKLNDRERIILQRAFRPGQPLFEKVLASARAYDRENNTNTADEILSIPAEARAYGFQHWRAGSLEVDGALATIFAKIKEFLSRIANAMRGLGFQSVEDIYRAIAKGEYAARQRREGGTVRRFVERDPADPRFAPDFESFFALMQAKWPQFNYGKWKELPNGDLRFPYALDFRQPRKTGVGRRFLQDITDWLDIQQRGSYIIAVPENPDEFSQEDLVKMYERRGWVPLLPSQRAVPAEEGIEMYRKPRAMNHDSVFGQVESVVREARADDPGSLDFTRFSSDGRERWYYSALTNAIRDDKSPKSASSQGWRDFLRGLKQKGVKPAEIEASGIEQWLDLQSGRVTREAVVDYLSTNGVKVEEVFLGGGDTEAAARMSAIEEEFYRLGKDLNYHDGRARVVNFLTNDELGAADLPEREAELLAEYETLGVTGGLPEQSTKFNRPDLILPGGTNYRELLLTLPTRQTGFQDWYAAKYGGRRPNFDEGGAPRAMRDQYLQETGRSNTSFLSSHYPDNPNLLAHVRFNDRTDAEGRRVLFIEEFQSDWASKGRKEGFGSRQYTAADLFAEKVRDGLWTVRNTATDQTVGSFVGTREVALASALERVRQGALGLESGSSVPRAPFVAKREFAVFKDGKELDRTDAKGAKHQVRYGSMEEAQQAATKLGGTAKDMGYGEDTAWVALAMKRMISYAAEHGYDKVAWTNGEQQVTRYRQALQKHVDRIEWEKTPEGVHLVGYKGKASDQPVAVEPEIYLRARRAIQRNDNLGFDTEQEALNAVFADRRDWQERWEVTTARERGAIEEYIEARRQVIRQVSRNKVVDTRYAENELSDAIGKAMADKIKADPAATGVIEGADITVSDTGMAGFYDRIVPNVANEILRKLGGGKVGEVATTTSNAELVTYFKNKQGSPYGADGTYNLHLSEDPRNHYAGLSQEQVRELVSPAMAEKIFSDAGHMEGNDNWYSHSAYHFAGTLTDRPQTKQQGFTITPQMRQAVLAGGLPLFNKGAIEPDVPQAPFMELSGRDMDRYFADAQLPREQKHRAAAQLLDDANLPDPTAKQLLGATVAEMGKVKEFLHKHIHSGTFLSRYSKGYENVQRVLSAFKQRQSQLFSHAVNVQLNTWVDASDADLEAASKMIFKATVGNIQKGTAEFTQLYGDLTTQQQAMVRQVFGDAKSQGMVADLLWKEFEADARDLKQELPDKEFNEFIQSRTTRITKLVQDSYVPERRYGDYTVKITKKIPSSEPGKPDESLTLFYDQFEVRGLAHLAAEQYKALLAAKGVEGLEVEFGTKHAADRDTSLSLRQFFSAARRHGVELTAAERQRIARALVEADSVRMNRIMQRKNVPGYSQDGRRVLTEFALAMSSKIAHSEFSDPIEAALQGRQVSTEQVNGRPVNTVAQERALWVADGPHSGFYRNLADRLADFVLSPPQDGKWASQLKSAGTLYFLGGNLSFGLVNLSSLPLNTIPFLTTVAPYTRAFSTVLSSFRTVAKNQSILRDVAKLSNRDITIEGIDAEMRSALIQAAEDGTTLDTQIHHLMGLTEGQQFTNSRKVQRAMDAWMWPFRTSEQINRITTFMSAYKLAAELKGKSGQAMTAKEKYEFARQAVSVTQGRYDQANMPGFAQSPLWSTLFMFKSFPIFMIEMLITLHKERPAAAVAMMLSLTMAAGVTGLPFVEDLMDIIDVVSQRLFGSAFNSKRAVRNVVKSASEAMVGADLSGLFLNGAINDWLGVNLSTRVGLGNLIPATRLGAADNDYKRTLEEVLGPVGGMLTAGAAGLDALTKGDFLGALKAGAPVAVRNVLKGGQQLASGEAVDSQGRKLLDVNGWEAFWQTMGFTSAGLNSMYQLDRLDKQAEAYYNQVREDFGQEFVKAVRTGDGEQAAEIMAAVQAWNEQNPEMPIAFAPALMRRRIAMAGMPLNARTLQLLPKQLRGTSISMEGMQE